MPAARIALALVVLFAPGGAVAQVQVDLSAAFTGDYVRNTGDTTDSTVDASGFNLVTAGVAGAGLGLPDNGQFAATGNHPAIVIAATDANNGNNAILLMAGGSATVSPPSGLYARLQVYSLATEGRASARVRVTYTDATTDDTTLVVPDWFDDPPPAGFFYVIDGMDRFSINNNTVERRADPAVFGFEVNVDRSKTVSTVQFQNNSTGTQRWVILGMTGESAGAVANDDTYSSNEDQVATANAAAGVLANDSVLDGGQGTASLGQPPRSGQLVLNADGSFRYTPNRDFNGTDVFTYTLESSNGGRASARASIVVLPVNDPPVAQPDAFGLVAPGRSVRLELLLNDSAGPDVGETLGLVSVSPPSAGGQVTIVTNTSVEYTSEPMYNGEERFTYVLGDGTPGSTDTATVTVRVGLPMGLPDAYALDEDTTLTVPVAQGVLLNDMAGDDRGLIAQIETTPTQGGVSLSTNGSFVYTPNRDYFGTDRFSYQAVNTFGGESGPVEVSLEVRPVNDPPTAVDDVVDAVAGLTTTISVLDNDSFAPDEGETLRVMSVGSPSAGGTAEVAGDGQGVVYTPAADFEGRELISYTIDDGDPTSRSTAVVTATVSAPLEPDAGVEPDSGPPDSGVVPDSGAALDAGVSPDQGLTPPSEEDGCRGTGRAPGSFLLWMGLGLVGWARRRSGRLSRAGC